MSEDVSVKELWNLFTRMSDVIETHRGYAKEAGVETPVVVRWDSTFFRGSRKPGDVFGLVLLNCLKVFEDIFIKQRHVSTETLQRFVQYANSERGATASIVELDNANPDGPLPDRFVKCAVRLNGYTFTYWNNDFLPNFSVEEP